LNPARSGRCAFEQQLTPPREAPADGTDVAALVGLGAGTLAGYLTKLLQTLFRRHPRDHRAERRSARRDQPGLRIPAVRPVALADLANGLAGRFLAFAAANPLRATRGCMVVGLTLYANAGMAVSGVLALCGAGAGAQERPNEHSRISFRRVSGRQPHRSP
jgi:hypothetical protein